MKESGGHFGPGRNPGEAALNLAKEWALTTDYPEAHEAYFVWDEDKIILRTEAGADIVTFPLAETLMDFKKGRTK